MVGQWTTEMGHVIRVIGGMDSQQKHIGQTGPRFVTVAKTRQYPGNAAVGATNVADVIVVFGI